MIIEPHEIVGTGILVVCPYTKVQQSGIDVSIRKIKRIISSNEKDITYSEEIILPHLLYPGVYDVECWELVDIPEKMAAVLYTRSTFNRRGTYVTSGLYDGGFHNSVGCVLHVTIPIHLPKNERIAQIVFFESEGEGIYDGKYNATK